MMAGRIGGGPEISFENLQQPGVEKGQVSS